ncbi:type II/IV secretion system protein [Patescibacteria group bacterium]|nr:type II/IV secretion system protein [Patescibacteria group bacterium]
MSLLTTLADKNIIRREDIALIEAEMVSSGDSLESILIKRGVAESEIFEEKASMSKLPTREVSDEVPYKVLKYVPEESARHYKFVPLGLKDGVLEVGLTDSNNLEALDALHFISAKNGVPYKIFLISETDFNKVLGMYEGFSGVVSQALEDLDTEIVTEEEQKDLTKRDKKKSDKKHAGEEEVIKEDAPVTKIVATILQYAVGGDASDIHIEPIGDTVRVRFRVDGVLNTSLVLPIKVLNAVVARIKILSSMKLDEKRKPQDGRFSARIEGRKIEFRVSTFPLADGEKVVMRILDPTKGVRELGKIGFSKRNIGLIRSSLTKPYGLVLISGPTGSGKSSTLYAMLGEVERDKKNVVSLEDPIEYKIEGVSQSQVFPEIGYTFATGLRSILRQDPDIIMVGEIRDKETADLAVQAALTGHLVFSTIHTNTAAGVIPRLVAMGIDPFLIAPTLTLVIAQRLVQTLCPDTGEAIPITGSLKLMLDKQFADLPDKYKQEIKAAKQLYKIKPTPSCPNGTRGRTAVVEVFAMNKDIENILLTNPVESEIYKIIRKDGMLTMKEDAIMKSIARIVPFEEVNTLTSGILGEEVDEYIAS